MSPAADLVFILDMVLFLEVTLGEVIEPALFLMPPAWLLGLAKKLVNTLLLLLLGVINCLTDFYLSLASLEWALN